MSKTSQRKTSQRDRNKRIAKNINAGGGFPFPTASVSELKLARKLAEKRFELVMDDNHD